MKIGFWGLLFIVLLVLKLMGHIDWSWWWVSAPLWGGCIVTCGFIFIAVMIAQLGNIKL